MSTANQLSMDIPPSWTWNPSVDQYNYYPNYYYYHGLSEREHLFEKPLTPSDVGKLNRLVIPKQHAERHFPLDGESGEKGLLLSFEDECGKAWRFRYSYWTSSQSYVLTKGWSRFVKEKRLTAGDVVLFERQRANADRLYIRWRRRGDAPGSTASLLASHWSPVLYGAPMPSSSSPNQESSEEQGAVVTTNSKTLRLFGVNLEFPSRELQQLPVHPQVEHQFLL